MIIIPISTRLGKVPLPLPRTPQRRCQKRQSVCCCNGARPWRLWIISIRYSLPGSTWRLIKPIDIRLRKPRTSQLCSIRCGPRYTRRRYHNPVRTNRDGDVTTLVLSTLPMSMMLVIIVTCCECHLRCGKNLTLEMTNRYQRQVDRGRCFRHSWRRCKERRGVSKVPSHGIRERRQRARKGCIEGILRTRTLHRGLLQASRDGIVMFGLFIVYHLSSH